MVAIINYGIGNLLSVLNMLERIGVDAVISDDTSEINSASHIIIPGVGHFDSCIKQFRGSGLDVLITKKVIEEKSPVLGICVGAQMMTGRSEEGTESGLGWIKGITIKFRASGNNAVKVPHMGWEDVAVKSECPLWKDIPEPPRFYFAHSYHFDLEHASDVAATAVYGYPFACAFWRGNIYGVQFHPEKSHRFGMKLLANFCNL